MGSMNIMLYSIRIDESMPLIRTQNMKRNNEGIMIGGSESIVGGHPSHPWNVGLEIGITFGDLPRFGSYTLVQSYGSWGRNKETTRREGYTSP